MAIFLSHHSSSSCLSLSLCTVWIHFFSVYLYRSRCSYLAISVSLGKRLWDRGVRQRDDLNHLPVSRSYFIHIYTMTRLSSSLVLSLWLSVCHSLTSSSFLFLIERRQHLAWYFCLSCLFVSLLQPFPFPQICVWICFTVLSVSRAFLFPLLSSQKEVFEKFISIHNHANKILTLRLYIRTTISLHTYTHTHVYIHIHTNPHTHIHTNLHTDDFTPICIHEDILSYHNTHHQNHLHGASSLSIYLSSFMAIRSLRWKTRELLPRKEIHQTRGTFIMMTIKMPPPTADAGQEKQRRGSPIFFSLATYLPDKKRPIHPSIDRSPSAISISKMSEDQDKQHHQDGGDSKKRS